MPNHALPIFQEDFARRCTVSPQHDQQDVAISSRTAAILMAKLRQTFPGMSGAPVERSVRSSDLSICVFFFGREEMPKKKFFNIDRIPRKILSRESGRKLWLYPLKRDDQR